jgi:serine/threonine protein kinase
MPTATQLIGPYQVLGSLGIGGMAEVFKVEHRHLGLIRALKVLRHEISSRPELVERLLAEARAMGRLRHPAVVEVFDCDVLQDGTAFIAMEYLRGEPLRLWMERIGRLAGFPRLAAALVGRVAEGLAFAHRQDVVHRDLKAENIFMVQDPGDGDRFTLKLLDFGVAKILREERPRSLTLDGCVIGTPTCMAPEQWSPGSAIDPRTDIYGLGCLFFELLCGRPPFLEMDDLAIMRAHCETEAPRVADLEPFLPPGFDPLVARMLAKAPGDRPRDLEEVLSELEGLVGQPRASWGDLLRTPPGFPVIVQDTLEMESTGPARSLARQSTPSHLARRGSAPTPGWLLALWNRTGRRRHPPIGLLARLRAWRPPGWMGAGLRSGAQRLAGWVGRLDRGLVPADWHLPDGPGLRDQLARFARGLIPSHWSMPGRDDPRARMAMFAGAGVLAASGLIVGLVLLTGDGPSAPVPSAAAPAPIPAPTAARAPARPRITATPLPRRSPARPPAQAAAAESATMTSSAGAHARVLRPAAPESPGREGTDDPGLASDEASARPRREQERTSTAVSGVQRGARVAAAGRGAGDSEPAGGPLAGERAAGGDHPASGATAGERGPAAEDLASGATAGERGPAAEDPASGPTADEGPTAVRGRSGPRSRPRTANIYQAVED